MERIVLAYSGSVDTSAAIPWLKEHARAEIVAVTMDLGQGRELEAIRDRALAMGALRAHVLDLRDEFADQFVLPALQADALYDDRSPMTAALGLPLVARKLVEIAGIEHAQAIAHGGRADDNPGAFDVLIHGLNATAKVMTPARDWRMTRAEVSRYAHRHGSPTIADSGYHVESNLWGRSMECDALEDETPEPIYTLTRPARECPDEPAAVEIEFVRGVPAAINGIAMPFMELIASLGMIAGAHGVGRIDAVEHRLGSARRREIGEAPAAVLLHAAHRELAKVSVPRELERSSRTVSAEYADLIDNGLWFSPRRAALATFVASVQAYVSGVVRFKLFKGASAIVALDAARSTPAIIQVAHV